jgi:DNA-binding PadR family transcriptional regulator
MRIESLKWLLTEIQKGEDTLYKLKKQSSSVVVEYLTYALGQGYITKKRDGKRRIYSLTPKGRQILKLI